MSNDDKCGATYCSDGNAGGHAGVEFSTCGRPRWHKGPWGDVPGTACRMRPTKEDLADPRNSDETTRGKAE